MELVDSMKQVQDSLKVVRELSFFEKQRQRIDRFDKMIMSYMQSKEKEYLFDTQAYRSKVDEIRALIKL